METRANFVLIGAFTLAGIVGLVGMLLWFARVELDQQFDYYDVRFSSVSGLSQASDVRFAGLPVGQVVDVRLSPDRDGTILVRLEVDAATPVRMDSVATIESQGVTGVSFVGISAGRPDTALLAADPDTGTAELNAGQSVIQALTEDAPLLIQEAITVIQEVNALLGSENQQRVENILQNAEDASDSLAATLDAFAEVPETVTRFTDQIEVFNTIIANLAPEVETLLTTADATVGSLGDLSDETRILIVTANDSLTVAQGVFHDAQRYISEDLSDVTNALEDTIARVRGEIDMISANANAMLATFDDAGAAIRDTAVQSQDTIAAATQTLSDISAASDTLNGAAARFDILIATQGEPMIADARAAISEATEAVSIIATAAQTDLPMIVAEIRSATEVASDTITQLASDLTAASGRVEGLSETAQTALTQVTETFANANDTLVAVSTAMETGDRTLAVAEQTFTGANRIINDDIDGIIAGLQDSVVALNAAIAQVSNDVPEISADLRAASRSASEAFASLDRVIDGSGPSVTDFTTTGLPLYTRLASETRGLIDNLDRLTQQIQRDPARFFLNQQSPEYQR